MLLLIYSFFRYICTRFHYLLSLDNDVLETWKRRAMFYNILSQNFIVKCFTKSLLIRIVENGKRKGFIKRKLGVPVHQTSKTVKSRQSYSNGHLPFCCSFCHLARASMHVACEFACTETTIANVPNFKDLTISGRLFQH